MSQPPPSRVPEEILRGAGVGIREYYTRLTSGLYYLWDQLKNITESRVTLIENALPGISGVVPTRDSATELTFSSGYISTGGKVYEVSEITKTLGTAWAEGDGGGEFSGATIGNTDDYYCIAISKDTAPSTVDIGFDDNASGTNAPSGWTVLKEVYRGMTNSSGQIDAKTVTETAGGGLRVKYPPGTTEFSEANAGTGEITKTLVYIPPDTEGIISWGLVDSSPVGHTYFICYETDKPTVVPSLSNYLLHTRSANTTADSSVVPLIVDSSRQVHYRLSNSDAGVRVKATTLGYQLERR